MKKFTRKDFIKTSGSALAVSFTPMLGFSKSIIPPSDTLNVGLIGCRGMGRWLLYHALNQPGIVCGGLCDIDDEVLESRAEDFKEQTGKRPALYKDYRKMLESKEIDAVFIATPDHWHCLQAIHAMEAGKHVYVEKPLANSIAECELITKAAQKYGKVVQVGQQQRSGEHWQKVIETIQSGYIGQIRKVKLWANFNYGKGPEKRQDEPVPDGIDYDKWLGPAPKRPFNRNRYHGSWRFFWDYGGGLLTDWGAHLFDIPLWALNIEGPPKSVSSIGGIYSGEDRDIDMADTQSVNYEFEDFNLVWEHTGGIETGPYGRNYGVAFIGNGGTLIVDRDGWEVVPEVDDEKPRVQIIPLQKPGVGGHEAHVANFFDAIRNGTDVNCPVEAANLAAFYGHIGNIAHRTNRKLSWDDQGILEHKKDFEGFIKPEYRSPWKWPKI